MDYTLPGNINQMLDMKRNGKMGLTFKKRNGNSVDWFKDDPNVSELSIKDHKVLTSFGY